VIADINLFGVFVDVALVTATVAAVLVLVLHRLLAASGAYRWVWHPPLVDLALFAVLWCALAAAAVHFQEHLARLFG
jgi:hypothetical protein